MPISVCQHENGGTHFQIVPHKRYPHHNKQLDTFLMNIKTNPFYVLDENNNKPLHKLTLSNGNVVYSTHTSIMDLINDISPKNNTHDNIDQFHHSNKLHKRNNYHRIKPAIMKPKLTHKKTLKDNDHIKQRKIMHDLTNLPTLKHHNKKTENYEIKKFLEIKINKKKN